MKKILMPIAFIFFSIPFVISQYSTPGTGIKWDLNDLVSNSGGAISFNGTFYSVSNDFTIAASDTLEINQAAVVKFASVSLFTINGVLLTGPDTVVFSSSGSSNYEGIRFENTPGSVLHNAVFEKSNGIKVISSDMLFDACVIRNNGKTYATGAINPFQCSPVIRNCRFLNNDGPAVMTGANAASSPQILYCYMFANNVSNANTPQINLGAMGTDSVRIIGNTIIGQYTMAGGIAVSTLAGGNILCRIENNTIRNNRYGIAAIGGNISSIIRYNIIENNNIQNEPNLGGSGINFNGAATNTAVVSYNSISGNLWGVTIQQSAQPNLGKVEGGISNPGLNLITNNGNSGYIYNLYNNTSGNIFAENNLWGTFNLDSVEMGIFHNLDNSSLGTVDYNPIYYPPFEYVTPGTGINWDLTSLAANSDGVVVKNGNQYHFLKYVTISETDTITITTPDTLLFADTMPLILHGVLNITSPQKVLFSALDTLKPWDYLAAFNLNHPLRNAIIEHGKGLYLKDANTSVENCIFRKNRISDGAALEIDSQTGKVRIENNVFENNYGRALFSYHNAQPEIRNNIFANNVNHDTVIPQLTLSIESDTCYLTGNRITGGGENSGGVYIYKTGDTTATIYLDNNYIAHNRYGIAAEGSKIKTIATNNEVESNGTEQTLESGCAFYFNGENKHYVELHNNSIRNNIWGITFEGNVFANMGTTHDATGYNYMENNGNSGFLNHLTNRTPNPVTAENNYWGTNNADSIEYTVYHNLDDSTLGMVDFFPFITTGIHDLNIFDISVFPNPAGNFVTVSGLGMEQVLLLGMDGKIWKQQNVHSAKIQFELTGIEPGCYILKVASGNSQKCVKIIKL